MNYIFGTAVVILLIIVFMGITADKGEYGYGWKTIECWDEGKLVYSAKWERCPVFAGEGYSKLESGKVIKAVCRCSTGESSLKE